MLGGDTRGFYNFGKNHVSLCDRLKRAKNDEMKNVLIAALLMVVSLHTYAQTDGSIDFDCSDFYGLDICGAGFEFNDDQITFVEENRNAFTTKLGLRFGTSLTNEDMKQIEKENAFKNSDSFRAYMKTLGSTESTSSGGEFAVTKRILDNKKFDLDCRLVTDRIYELSSSNYYDCALQRHF